MRCLCDCGREKHVRVFNLKNKKHPTRTCGCRCLHVTHGMTRGRQESPEYRSWSSMIQRCTNPKHHAYDRYGGRGIQVCDRWRSFAVFLSDMGPRPSLEHSLDRYPDNNGNYEPGNCRWATAEQQAGNCRHNRFIEANGVARSVREWAEATGIPSRIIWGRLHRGWTDVDAVTHPHPSPRREPRVIKSYHQDAETVLSDEGKIFRRP